MQISAITSCLLHCLGFRFFNNKMNFVVDLIEEE